MTTKLFIEPKDGWTLEEMSIQTEIVIKIYESIGDDKDRFLVMACWQLGYNQEDMARVMKISQEAISKRLVKVKEEIKKNVKLNSKL